MKPASGVACLTVVLLAIAGCGPAPGDPHRQIGADPYLPAINQYLLPPMHIAKVVPWNGATPSAAPGLKVRLFAKDLASPRSLYVLPNGDVLVVETGGPPAPVSRPKELVMNWVEKMTHSRTPPGQRILLFRDTNGDGVPDEKTVFIDHLNSPFGVVLVGNDLYVANTDAIMRFSYTTGQTEITEPGAKLCDLPGGPIDHHWTKSLTASPDGTFLYAGVGSNSNITENGIQAEVGRAAVWQVDRATGAHREYATGVRQPDRAAVRAAEPRALGGRQRTGRIGSGFGSRLFDLAAGRRLLWMALQLLRTACRSAGATPATGPRGQSSRAGLRVELARGAAGAGVLRRLRTAGSLPGRRIRRGTRKLEPPRSQWPIRSCTCLSRMVVRPDPLKTSSRVSWSTATRPAAGPLDWPSMARARYWWPTTPETVFGECRPPARKN